MGRLLIYSRSVRRFNSTQLRSACSFGSLGLFPWIFITDFIWILDVSVESFSSLQRCAGSRASLLRDNQVKPQSS